MCFFLQIYLYCSLTISPKLPVSHASGYTCIACLTHVRWLVSFPDRYFAQRPRSCMVCSINRIKALGLSTLVVCQNCQVYPVVLLNPHQMISENGKAELHFFQLSFIVWGVSGICSWGASLHCVTKSKHRRQPARVICAADIKLLWSLWDLFVDLSRIFDFVAQPPTVPGVAVWKQFL